MANTQKIGVVSPVAYGDWSATNSYQILSMVRYNGATYIAKTQVPAGTLPTNTAYFVLVAQDGANGQDGTNGLTPYIGENGNWFIGDTDTGVPASGGGGSGLSIKKEKLSILTSDWQSLSNSQPFFYQTTTTATTTLNDNDYISLAPDDVVLFANYGFQIGATQGQQVTIYALAVPPSNVDLTLVILSLGG